MNLITRFVLSLILVTFSISSFSNDESSEDEPSEEEIIIKIRDIKVGYVHPKYRHQAGTNLKQYFDERKIIHSNTIDTKRDVAIGAAFEINSNLGQTLQVASVVVASTPDSDIDDETFVTLDTIMNGDIVRHWRLISSKKDKEFSHWHYQFFLIAMDDDIISDIKSVKDVEVFRNAISIYSTTFQFQ